QGQCLTTSPDLRCRCPFHPGRRPRRRPPRPPHRACLLPRPEQLARPGVVHEGVRPGLSVEGVRAAGPADVSWPRPTRSGWSKPQPVALDAVSAQWPVNGVHGAAPGTFPPPAVHCSVTRYRTFGTTPLSVSEIRRPPPRLTPERKYRIHPFAVCCCQT